MGIDLLKSAKHKGYELKIYYSDDLPNPRRENENLGYLLCYHPNYNSMGDYDPKLNDYPTIESVQEALTKKIKDGSKSIGENDILGYLPLYVYDHSSVSISWEGSPWDPDHWDTSFVGYYIFTKKQLRDYDSIQIELDGLTDNELVDIGIEIAKKEIRQYDEYILGDILVVDCVLLDLEDSIIDSLSGYFVGVNGYLNEAIVKNILDELDLTQVDVDDIDNFKRVMASKILENL